jgi:hypothetical protein
MSRSPNDLLLPVDIEPEEHAQRRSRATALVPLALALFGVGAILIGGISAKTLAPEAGAGIDPMVTGSIPSGNIGAPAPPQRWE